MAVTVKDLLGLDIMKNFKLIAGGGGLTKTITATEILDFEFVQEGYRTRTFDGNSLVLSSLLFAKDRPELIFEAIKKLCASMCTLLHINRSFLVNCQEKLWSMRKK